MFIVALLLALSTPNSGPSSGNEAEWRRQFKTVSIMRSVAELIDQFREDHAGHVPESLDALPSLREQPHFGKDGWNRSLYYYSTGSTYVIASFGRSGRPDRQESTPGGLTTAQNFEDDIVMVNGTFAQTPFNIDPN